MDIFPISCESLGSRSFAHFIITKDVNILIDPSVSLAPRRFGLPPHPLEIAVSWISRRTILELISLTDVLIQTHYHGDHFTLGVNRAYEFTNIDVFNQVYSPHLIILAKDPEENLNYNQQKRAKWLWKKAGLNIHIADNNVFKFGETEIKFSSAVPHGYDTKRGCVVETLVTDSSMKYLYTSDVSGPSSQEAVSFILEVNPDVLVLDGPSTYHPNVFEEEIKAAFTNLKIITKKLSKVFIDHHFLRTVEWKKILQKEIGEILPAFSQIQNREPLLLEATRKNLYEEINFDQDFHTKFLKGEDYSVYFKELLKNQGYLNYWDNMIQEIKQRWRKN